MLPLQIDPFATFGVAGTEPTADLGVGGTDPAGVPAALKDHSQDGVSEI